MRLGSNVQQEHVLHVHCSAQGCVWDSDMAEQHRNTIKKIKKHNHHTLRSTQVGLWHSLSTLCLTASECRVAEKNNTCMGKHMMWVETPLLIR